MFLSIEPALTRRGHIQARFAQRALEGSRHEFAGKLLSALEDAPDKQADRRLLCRACGQAITSEQDRISVQGMHEHHRINPHGVSFHFGCFRQAPGAAEIGAEALEHTWFEGFSWRIMLCARCGSHLGWSFCARGGHRFCGLILDRLILSD